MALRIKTEDCAHCGGSGKQPAAEGREQLRSARMRAGISLRALSSAMGISLGYLGDLERGNRKLTGRLAALYAEKLEVLDGE